jgi:hypothetical protein
MDNYDANQSDLDENQIEWNLMKHTTTVHVHGRLG